MEIITGDLLNDNQLNKISKLILETGDYEITSRDNILGLTSAELQHKLTVVPAKNYLNAKNYPSQPGKII